MKKIAYAVSMALGLGLAATAQSAINVVIDPNGSNPTNGSISVAQLDWALGNAISYGANASSPRGTPFTTYAQARLAQFNDQNGNSYSVTSFGVGGFEWTYVAG